VSERAFERPGGFDASEYLSRAMATLPRTIATEVFLKTDLASARQELHQSLGVPEAAEGGVLLRGSADFLDWYARELMRLPFRFEVRQPKELAAVIAKLAGELVEQFGR